MVDEVKVETGSPVETEKPKPIGFSPAEAAQILGGEEAGWTAKRLRRMIRGKECEAIRVEGHWRLTEEHLEKLLVTMEAKAAASKAKAEAAAAKKAAKAAAEAEVQTAPVDPSTSPMG